jgi:hypothetical protein
MISIGLKSVLIRIKAMAKPASISAEPLNWLNAASRKTVRLRRSRVESTARDVPKLRGRVRPERAGRSTNAGAFNCAITRETLTWIMASAAECSDQEQGNRMQGRPI